MRKLILAAGGAIALGLLAGTPTASAGSVGSAGSLLKPFVEQAGPEDVRWVRQCYNVRRWWNGRRIWVRQCHNVWVGARYYGDRYYGRGYYGRGYYRDY